MAYPFIKITLQQHKKKMQPLLQRKITYHRQPELSSLSKSNELVYCVTIEQSIEIYHDAYFTGLNNRCGYICILCILYFVYIYIYIYRHSLWCTLKFMGITEIQGMKRWQKKKNALCIKTKLFILLWLKKK